MGSSFFRFFESTKEREKDGQPSSRPQKEREGELSSRRRDNARRTFQNVRGMPAVLGRTFFLSKSGSPCVGQSWMKWPGFWQRWHT